MKINIKHILINVNIVKPGFVVLVDGMFGVITNVDGREATIMFTDDATAVYQVKEICNCVVKFLAITKDLRSFPIKHGDFYTIISNFQTKELVEKFVNGKQVSASGIIRNVDMLPKVEDLIELKNITIADQHNLLTDRLLRVGVVKKVKVNKYSAAFGDKSISLDRSDFTILSSLDCKQVMELVND